MSQATDWAELAKDCVAFANATGGHLLIGIEDGQDLPPADQLIPAELPNTLRRKLAERTINVAALPFRHQRHPPTCWPRNPPQTGQTRVGRIDRTWGSAF